MVKTEYDLEKAIAQLIKEKKIGVKEEEDDEEGDEDDDEEEEDSKEEIKADK